MTHLDGFDGIRGLGNDLGLFLLKTDGHRGHRCSPSMFRFDRSTFKSLLGQGAPLRVGGELDLQSAKSFQPLEHVLELDVGTYIGFICGSDSKKTSKVLPSLVTLVPVFPYTTNWLAQILTASLLTVRLTRASDRDPGWAQRTRLD